MRIKLGLLGLLFFTFSKVALANDVCPERGNLLFELSVWTESDRSVVFVKPKHRDEKVWLDPDCEYQKLIFLDDIAILPVSPASYEELDALKARSSITIEHHLFLNEGKADRMSNSIFGSYQTFDWHTGGTAGTYTDVVRLSNNSSYFVSSVHTQFGDYWLTPFGVVWPENSRLNLIRQILALW